MEDQLEGQRDQLRTRAPETLAEHSGAKWNRTGPDTGTLSLLFMGQSWAVPVPDYVALGPDGNAAPTMMQAMITAYLLAADGTPRAGEWIAFRELPDGVFYHQAFTGYTGGRMARALGNNLAAFQRGAQALGGRPLSGFGDAAYEFQLLPRIWIAVAYWLGDDEDGFPPQARVLFDAAASHYMITDGLAIMGSMLVGRILAGAGA